MMSISPGHADCSAAIYVCEGALPHALSQTLLRLELRLVLYYA